MPEPPRTLYTVEQAAEQLSIGRTSMFALIKQRAIESIKVGRLRRVPASALTVYIDRLSADQRPVA